MPPHGISTMARRAHLQRAGRSAVQSSVGSWIRPGTVSLPKGLWRRHTANGYTTNALVPDTLTDLGGGACFNDARVQVEGVVNSSRQSGPVGVERKVHTSVVHR